MPIASAVTSALPRAAAETSAAHIEAASCDDLLRSFDDWSKAVVAQVDHLMEAQLTAPPSDCPPILQEAMRYACLGGGKRIRPLMIVASAAAAMGSSQRALELPGNHAVWRVALAVEMLHAFSLVHDDLPAMDDDDMRRGRPTVHRAFDEATAILAGDALTVRAFELLADPAIPPVVASRLVREVAGGIGWMGVIAGQVLDLQAEHTEPTLAAVEKIHRLKTAALMRVSCRCGAIAAEADADAVDALSDIGDSYGMAFQAVDDLLDETATEAQLGKRVRQDRAHGKATLCAAVGVARARQIADDHIEHARSLLTRFAEAGFMLRAIGDRIMARV